MIVVAARSLCSRTWPSIGSDIRHALFTSLHRLLHECIFHLANLRQHLPANLLVTPHTIGAPLVIRGRLLFFPNSHATPHLRAYAPTKVLLFCFSATPLC